MTKKNCIEVRPNPYIQTALALYFGFDAYRNYISNEINILTIIFYLSIVYVLINNYIHPKAKITRNKIKILKWTWWFNPPVTYSYAVEQIVITNKSFIFKEKKLFSTFWTDIKPQELREFCLQKST